MSWYWIAGAAAAALLLAYVLACWIVSRKIALFFAVPRGERRHTLDFVRAEQTELGYVDYAAYDAMPKERFRLSCDGVELACEFIPPIVPPPAGERPKCLIRIHGHSQNRMISVRFLPVFQKLGYACVIFDQRAFGESTGDCCTFGVRERYDVRRIIDWVKQRMGEDTLIGLHGESLGAITAMMALGVDSRIDFVIEDSGCSNAYDAAKIQLKRAYHLPVCPLLPMVERLLKRRFHFGLRDVDPIAQIREASVPVLFLHGTADEEIPAEMCPQLTAAAKHPLSRMALFEGSRHCQGHRNEPKRYEAIVERFVKDAEAVLR